MSEWYLSQNGQQGGPFSSEQVAAMARDGSLTDQVYLAGPGLTTWTVASQVPLVQQARSGAGPAPWQGSVMGQPMGAPAMGAPAMGQPMGAPLMGQPAAMGYAVAAAPGAAKGNWLQERLKGLGAIALGVLIAVANVASIMMTETFYPKSVIAAFGAFFYGGWVLVFGDEFDDETMELVRWKQIGMYGSGAVGVLIGIVISIAIAD